MFDHDENTRVNKVPPELVGAILNSTYQVRQLIAKGGMGEVYEGVTVSDVQNRVAIKIIRPELANDPNLQRMFRQEARALEQMNHPGLVQYRVFARDPDRNVHYIVMEFVDGPNLSAVLSILEVDKQRLLNFTVRIASALAAAHEVGRFHRDICPQNILLPKGVLEHAKIIDFGIVKKTTEGGETFFTTEGAFAGHLGYAAPEQFDNAEIGPWTDIYSMGLTVLAVAGRKAPDMGTSILKAVKMRQAVPDLSTLPRDLHLLFSRMLAPDPAHRLRSMHEVIVAIDEISKSGSNLKLPKTSRADTSRRIPSRQKYAFLPAFGAVGIAVAAGAALWFWPSRSSQLQPQPQPQTTISHSEVPVSIPSPILPPPTPALPGRDEIIERVDAALAGMKCQWLQSDYPSSGYPAPGQNLRIMVSGVRGSPDDLVAELQRAAALPSGSMLDVDASGVWSVQPSACAVLDAMFPFRDVVSGQASLLVEKARFTIGQSANGLGGKLQAEVNVTVNTGDPPADFSLVSLRPDGQMLQLIANRATFNQMRRNATSIKDLGGNRYTMTLNSPAGLYGLVILKGKGPFDLGLKTREYARAAYNLPDRFANLARLNGWTVQMTWYEVTDSTGAVQAGSSAP